MAPDTGEERPAAQIRAAAAKRAEAMLTQTRRYVEQESVTGDRSALDRLNDDVADRHRALGGTVSVHSTAGGSHLRSDFSGTGAAAGRAPVLLVGHTDTVWPRGQLSTMPWRVSEGTAHGPGIYDMKSGLVVMETALELLAELSVEHPPIRIVITSDEEIGSPSSRQFLLTAADGVGAALGFESPHPDGALKAGRHGSTRLQLRVTGREAHAALDPDSGVSAIDELVDQLIALRKVIDEAEAAGRTVLCNVGTLDGGGRTNVVPASASADVGLRFADAATERLVLERISTLTPVRSDARVEVDILSSRPAWAAGGGTAELLAVVQEAAGRVGQTISGRPAAGAADTNLLGAHGIPTLDGFGPRGAGAHATHEQIEVASLPERAALVTAVLAAL